LHSIKIISLFLLFTLLGCELDVSRHTYYNPYDLDANKVLGVFPPALIFSPRETDAKAGESILIKVSLLEVTNVGGAHAQLTYDNTRLKILDVKAGSFFGGNRAPLFLFEDNDGTLDIYSSFLGLERTVSGSGDIAIVSVEIIGAGRYEIKYTEESELLNAEDLPIKLNGLGLGVINAK